MNIFKRILPLLFVLSLFIFLPFKTKAAEFLFKNNTVAQDQTIEDDLYVIGADANIYGVVDGDLFVLSDNITLTGTVTGDTYLFGMNTIVEGNIYGNLISISNSADIKGIYGGNSHIISSLISYEGQTAEDLTILGIENSINGSVGDDLRVFGYKSVIESIVKDDLIYFSEQYNILEENVSGNIYDKDILKNIAKEQGVEVEEYEEEASVSLYSTLYTKFIFSLISLVGLSITGYILIYISPVKTGHIVRKVTGSPTEFLKSLGIGFAIVCLIPIPIVILMFSMIGTPLALLVTSILIFLFTFGKIYTETALGKEILDLFKVKGYRPYKSLITGRIVTTLVSLIPIVGTFYNFVLGCTTLGAVTRIKYSAFKNTKKK